MDAKEKKFWDDLEWGEAHQSELLEKYEDKWVAINDRRVVASGINLGRVQSISRKKTGKKEVPVVFIESGLRFYGQY